MLGFYSKPQCSTRERCFVVREHQSYVFRDYFYFIIILFLKFHAFLRYTGYISIRYLY